MGLFVLLVDGRLSIFQLLSEMVLPIISQCSEVLILWFSGSGKKEIERISPESASGLIYWFSVRVGTNWFPSSALLFLFLTWVFCIPWVCSTVLFPPHFLRYCELMQEQIKDVANWIRLFITFGALLELLSHRFSPLALIWCVFVSLFLIFDFVQEIWGVYGLNAFGIKSTFVMSLEIELEFVHIFGASSVFVNDNE